MEKENLIDKQYKTSANFDARVLTHTKYAINKTPWPIWLFNQYVIIDDASILELGCGNGLLWKVNEFRINPKWRIFLSDISMGMLEKTKTVISGKNQNIEYSVIDASKEIKLSTKFDIIIANHMLYHIENRDEAISNIAKALTTNGKLYSSTVGNTNMDEVKKTMYEYCGNHNYAEAISSITNAFSKENGKEQLFKHFKSVEWIEYEDGLNITDSDDFVNYIYSCNNLKPGLIVIEPKERDEFSRYIKKLIQEEGKIHVSKSSGTFISSN